MLIKRVVSLLLLTVPAFLFASQSASPKVGLVLGGGGAKGGAHVGVLKVLEANRVKIDFIAGTSIGAYVAGMYALGYSADEIEHFMLSEDWERGYSDEIARDTLRYRDKLTRDKFNLQFNLGFNNGVFKASKGLLVGQSMYSLLRHSTDLVHSFNSFDDLAIPYRAIATDLATVEAISIDSGSIVEAMQASASVPGAVQPTEIDGRLLVDGGIANNLPIDVVKKMGADIVIAVDIGSSLSETSQFSSTVEVLNQLSNIMTNASTQAQKKNLTKNDIYIRPAIDDLSTTDWQDLPRSLERGVKAANAQLEKIVTLSVTKDNYATYLADKKSASADWFKPINSPILAITLENQSPLSDQLILKHFAIKLGQTISEQDIQLAVNRVYALDAFERVETEFKDTEQGRVLVLKTVAKSWGPNYIDFGANYQSDVTVNSVLSLDVGYTMTEINDLGAEWLNELSLGFEEFVASEFYQPLSEKDDLFTRARLAYVRNRYELQTATSTSYKLEKHFFNGELALGYNVSNHFRIELGLSAENGKLKQRSILDDQFDYDLNAVYANVLFDSLDSISFPSKGNRFRFQIASYREHYDPFFTSEEELDSVSFKLDWRGAFSIRHHALVGSASFATYESSGYFTANTEQLGGFLNLSGYGKNVLIGPKKVFGAVIYQYDLGRDVLNMTNTPLYVGVSAEAGNVWQLEQDIDLDDLIYASSIFVGTDTRFGPAAIGFGVSDDNERSFFVSLGKHW